MTEPTRHISLDDFIGLLSESRELIIGEMRRGFDGVHQRQDETNGRVRRLEVTSAEHELHIDRMLRDTDGEGERSLVRAKDVMMFGLGGGMVIGALKLLGLLR